MKKYLYLFILILSSCFFIENIKADYKATAVNPSGAKCSLRQNSTGPCYYSNSNLNNYVPGVVWLDNGDEVTVITSKNKINSPNIDTCSDYYVYTSYYSPLTKTTHYGYYCNAYLKTNALTNELREELKNEGFPESYWEKLAFLKLAHPNWSFKAINTGIDFNVAVTNEEYGDRNLLRGSMSNNYSYLSLSEDSFNYFKDKFIPYDDVTGSDPWYKVNRDTIAYYLDPRNFLFETDIFQFETLSYNENITNEQFKESIGNIFGNDYLKNFIDNFVEAGSISKVNPIYLASLSKHEIANGDIPGTAIDGKYNGTYNFYNIGANSGEDPVYNGLNFAINKDDNTMRPWDSEYKAIVGGAKWIYSNYVYHGQDTSYFKKFNVVYNYLKSIDRSPVYSNYEHQYMQNIDAPSSEARTTQRSYYESNLLDLNYTFYIPVYNNMPSKTNLPTKTGWPNNYLSKIIVNGNEIADFVGDVETYNFYLDINKPNIEISAKAVSNNAKVSGTGNFDIKEDTTKEIVVTAKNGDIKKYKINIILTGEKIDDPIDIITTLNNSGIKNGEKYLTGFNIGTNIDTIKTKILGANSSAIVELKDHKSKEKINKPVATDDNVIITVGDETKTFKIVIYGDINGDSEINALDFIQIKKFMLKENTLSGANHESADMNKDGDINALDYILLKKYMLGDNNAIKQ